MQSLTKSLGIVIGIILPAVLAGCGSSGPAGSPDGPVLTRQTASSRAGT